jgi:hypothetical protein
MNSGVGNGEAYFRLLQGAQDKGMRFLFLMTRNCPSGEWAPALDEVVDGGVGDIFKKKKRAMLNVFSSA